MHLSLLPCGFLGSGLSPSRHLSCKMQNAKGAQGGRGNNMQQVASCQRLRNVLGEEPLQSVDYSRNAWQRLPLRVTEARGRGRQRESETDRPKRLLATLVCVCVSASSSIHNRLETRPWPLKVTSVKRAFFFIFVSLSWGRCTRPLPLSLKLSREEAPMNSRTAEVKTSLESHVAHNHERGRGAERGREGERTIKGNCF